MPAHEFTVDFLRYMSDDQEIADKAFQGGTPQERLTKQLCEELDANPALVGTYTVESLSIQGDEESFSGAIQLQALRQEGARLATLPGRIAGDLRPLWHGRQLQHSPLNGFDFQPNCGMLHL